MEKSINSLDILYNSKCLTCMHRISRVVEPLSQEDRDYYFDMVGLDSTDSLDIILEQHKCMLTDEEIDGVIRDCNQYSIASRFNLIRDYKF